MRIAVSGTHFLGKSTLIDDFIKHHSEYTQEIEPYYKILEERTLESSLEPSLESSIEQLNYSIKQISSLANQKNVIFDRCPVDFIAYAMCALEQDAIEIYESAIAEYFPDIKEALNNLDLIVFIPLCKENSIEYTEENPVYRKMADKYFKQIYRDDVCDIFPRYNHPRIIEITGSRTARIKQLEIYLLK
jgi:hypothetical protein